MRDEAKQLSPSEIRKMAAEHYTTEEKVRDHLERVFDKMLKAVKPKSREAIFLQNQYDKMSKLWDAALEKAVENTRAAEQTQAKEEMRQRIERQRGEVQLSERAEKVILKDPAKLTEADAKTVLQAAKANLIKDSDYIPIRANTPEALRNFVDLIEKQRGVKSEKDITAMTTDRALIISGKKARQAQASQFDFETGEGHEYTDEEIVELLKRIDKPRYMVYEEDSGNYAIVVNYKSALCDKAIVFFDFNEFKKAEQMNGFRPGNYNTAITIYPNSRPKTIKTLLDTRFNKVYDPYGKKGNVQVESGSLVPSTLNTSPFYIDSISDAEGKSNTEFSMRSEVEKPWDEMTPEERTATINATMTMQQAKAMIDKAYTAGGIRDWYEEYRNADQWLRGEGSAEVAMYIENEYELQRKYINSNIWASLVLKFRLIFTVCGS